MIYDPISFGAVGDGSVFSAPGNTVALQKCFSQPNGPGPTYIPPTVGGIVVNNNALVVSKPNTVIYGDASMGSVPSWGPTSTIIGHGPGHTLQVLQGGCRVERLAWKSLAPAGCFYLRDRIAGHAAGLVHGGAECRDVASTSGQRWRGVLDSRLLDGGRA